MSHSVKLISIIKDAGLNPEDVLLIRHSKGDKKPLSIVNCSTVLEYTRVQDKTMPTKHKYWLVFIAEEGTTAKFYACYINNGYSETVQNYVYDLEETSILSDLKNRLVIDWGKGTIKWYQNGTNNKDVIYIKKESRYDFPGYENLVLNFEGLNQVINNSDLYSNWYESLSSVYGIYLITDTSNGKLYVGSAYGCDGILGRWREYIKTKHGGNKKLMALLKENPDKYKDFQFSILQICPKTAIIDDVITLESLYKKKFKSIDFGMNDN